MALHFYYAIYANGTSIHTLLAVFTALVCSNWPKPKIYLAASFSLSVNHHRLSPPHCPNLSLPFNQTSPFAVPINFSAPPKVLTPLLLLPKCRNYHRWPKKQIHALFPPHLGCDFTRIRNTQDKKQKTKNQPEKDPKFIYLKPKSGGKKKHIEATRDLCAVYTQGTKQISPAITHDAFKIKRKI